MKQETESNIQALHSCYCQITGRMPSLSRYERDWYNFIKAGYTETDLRCVLLFLVRENRRMGGRCAYSLRLGKLLDFEFKHFEDVLSEARSKERNRRHKPTPRERVLASYLKPVDAEKAPASMVCRSVKDVLRGIVNSP